MPARRAIRPFVESKFLFLRVKGVAYDEVADRLPDLAPILDRGRGTAADPDGAWFAIGFPTPKTIVQVRDELARRGLADHVVRVDLMPKRIDGPVFANQLGLFGANA